MNIEKINFYTEEEIKKWDKEQLQKKFLELQNVAKTAEILIATQRIETKRKDKTIELMAADLNKNGYSNKEIIESYQNRAFSILKDDSKQEVSYLKEINEERKKINEKLNNELTNLVRKGENLENYELWVNEKCDIFINPIYIIKRYAKKLENEGFDKDTAYVILKIDPEAGEIENETN